MMGCPCPPTSTPNHATSDHAIPFLPLLFPPLMCVTYPLCLSQFRWQTLQDRDCDLLAIHMVPDRSPNKPSRLYQTYLEVMQPWIKQWSLTGRQDPRAQWVKLVSNVAVQHEFKLAELLDHTICICCLL